MPNALFHRRGAESAENDKERIREPQMNAD